MSEFVLTTAERALFAALGALKIRYLLVGMGAALLEGASGTTQDLDLWFGRLDEAGLKEAARRAGGFYTPGLGMQAPLMGERVSTGSRSSRRRSRRGEAPAKKAKARNATSAPKKPVPMAQRDRQAPSRVMPGIPSNPMSKLMIRVAPSRSMTAA